MPKIFIHNHSFISHQSTFNQDQDWPSWKVEYASILQMEEPPYNDFVAAAQTRRLAKIIKAGLVCGIDAAIQKTGIERPDAIITATGQGSLQDTERFLLTMINDKERMLNPASFINATFNSLNGILGIYFNANCYANTYVHRGFSFTSALQDAMLLIEEQQAKNVLVGAFDEMSADHYFIKRRMGFWKKEGEIINLNELLKSQTDGTIAGEGTAFFVLSPQKPEGTYAVLKDTLMVYKPTATQEVLTKIEAMCAENQLTTDDIDVVVCGKNGDGRHDFYYEDMVKHFKKSTFVAFKHLFGEYDTADSAGVWLGCEILKKQTIPANCIYKNSGYKSTITNVLIYNHYFGQQHTAVLLRCES